MMRTPPPKKKKKHAEAEPVTPFERCLWILVGVMGLVACGTMALGIWLLLMGNRTAATIVVTATPTQSIVQVVENPITPSATATLGTPAPVTVIARQSPVPTQQAVFIPVQTLAPTNTATPRPFRIVTAIATRGNPRLPSVAWGNDAIAVGRFDGVLIYDPATLGLAPQDFALTTSEILDVALSPDGSLVVGAAGDGRLIVWQTDSTGLPLVELPAGRNPIWTVAFSRDGITVLAGTDRGLLRAWDIETQRETLYSAADETLYSVAIHPTAPQLAAGSYTGGLFVWNTDRTQLAAIPDAHTGFLWALDYSPDGTVLVSAGQDGRVVWWDTTDFSQITVLDGLDGVAINDVAFNADGSQVAAAAEDGRVIVWAVATRRPIRTLQHPAPVTSLAFSPSDNRLLTAATDGALRVWSPDSDTPRTLPGR